MEKLRVAILEDNKELLKDLKQNLEETRLVTVSVWAHNSEEFIQKMSASVVDALLLDIDLGGDSMSGLDIANKFKLPVLFVSGKTKEYYQNIEDLNINTSITVEHITKPITLDKLNKILPKFIKEITTLSKTKNVMLNFGKKKIEKIEIDSIVFIETETGDGGKSGNKKIYFSNRKPETLIDIDFDDLSEKGLDKQTFIKPHRSYRVNASKIISYNRNHELEVFAMNQEGKIETRKIPVSENFKKDVLSVLK